MKTTVRFLLVLALLLSLSTFAAFANTDNSNDIQFEVEEWEYVPNQNPTDYFDLSGAVLSEDSVANEVKVTVKTINKYTGEEEIAADAEVSLYSGERLVRTVKTDEDGLAVISLEGLSIEEKYSATISAKKVVSSGTGIDGDGRDKLFSNYPTNDEGEYIRYQFELHSEKIDANGNWIGENIPKISNTNKVDVVFAIDATGSMGDEINNVKNNISSFAESLTSAGLDVRFSIIEYRDIKIGEETIVHTLSGSHWYTTVDNVVEVLGNIRVTGGGDGPETPIDALGYLVDDDYFGWRSDANKFAFLLTDADHWADNNHDIEDMEELAYLLSDMNIVTSVISPTSYRYDYEILYTATGGIFADIYSYDFDEEMLSLAGSIVESVGQEMTLVLTEPRMLVNMSVCYYADDDYTQSAEYKDNIIDMLDEYSLQLAQATDGHVLIDKVILFSTDDRLAFYDTDDVASMADIRIETEENDERKVKIHNNAYVNGFFTDSTITVDNDYLKAFKHLSRPNQIRGRETFTRILSGGIDVNDSSMFDDVKKFAATQVHETGHYLLGFFDEYMDQDGKNWRRKPYSQFGLMDNQYADIELSKSRIEYLYKQEDPDADSTYHYHVFGESCEDTLSNLLSFGSSSLNYNEDNNSSFFYNYVDEYIFDGSIFDEYEITYTKASSTDRRAEYSYARLASRDIIDDIDTGDISAILSSDEQVERDYFNDLIKTSDKLADITKDICAYESDMEFTLECMLDGEYEIYYSILGDDFFTRASLSTDDTTISTEIPIYKGAACEIRVVCDEYYNVYFVDRTDDCDETYLYNSVTGTTMAYVENDDTNAYTFISDSTPYEYEDYFSVNEATILVTEYDIVGGEIYSVASYMDNIDYTTLSWFKYDFNEEEWTILDTELSEDENMNIGACADLDGNGLYVLMATEAPVGDISALTDIDAKPSAEVDGVVTFTFTNDNPDSKYYNVYYSEEEFSDTDEEGVVVRTFGVDKSSDKQELTLDFYERDRTIYAAFEAVNYDGARSELSEVIEISTPEADRDFDGVPDWYCDEYNLWGRDGEDKDIARSDDDGDGLTNYEEYVLGSDPTNPNDPAHTTNIPVETITASEDYIELSIGKTKTVEVEVGPENATNKKVRWSIDDDDIAEIEFDDLTCTITALSEGSTTLYAITEDGGYSTEIEIEVTEILPEAFITFSGSTARPGDIIDVTVHVSNITDANSFGFRDFEYDSDAFELLGFTNIQTEDAFFSLYDEELFTVNIGYKEPTLIDQDMFTLRFLVLDTADEGDFEISATTIVKNSSLNIVTEITEGIITIYHRIKGDIDGDDNININDAILLFQYSMMPELYPIDYPYSLDFNKDGTVDLADAILLFQHSMMPELYPI